MTPRMRNKKTVLVIDDDVIVRDQVALALSAEGCLVQAADTLDSAQQVIREEPPDIVLLDVFLPGLSVSDFCRGLREQNRLCRVVLMAQQRPGTQVLGLFEFLAKPFDERQLIKVVGSCAA